MVDGECTEYDQARLKLENGIVVYMSQDAANVWLCFALPDGSNPAAEFVLDTARLEEPIALHMSAQLGEWPSARPEEAPDKGTSERWWNQQGWSAVTSKFNGLIEGRDPPRVNFRRAPAQEMQFRKSRFGEGTWHLSGYFFRIRDHAGEAAQGTLGKDGLVIDVAKSNISEGARE